jgi:lipopolysaccharide/colanic/teichoic acid biosynthesis glycosyltransferase
MEWLTALVDEQVSALRGLWRNKRQLSFSVLNLAMIVFSALMIWKTVMVVTASESPVVVVLRRAGRGRRSGRTAPLATLHTAYR